MTNPNDDLGFVKSPESVLAPADTDPVMDEFRALVLPSSQLPARAESKDLDANDQTLGDSLKSFIKELTEGLGKAADDLSSLEVRTFGAGDLSKVTYDYDTKAFTGELQLRALTRLAFDGDVLVVVPEKNGELNEALWNAHLSMVKEAQANRAQFLGAMAEMAARLIQLFSKP
jgi:hypothetical protein